MFSGIPKPIQNAIAISITAFFSGVTFVTCAFAWKSLDSDAIDLQVANENLKITANLKGTQVPLNKVKSANEISKGVVAGLEEQAKQTDALRKDLLAEVNRLGNSPYCGTNLDLITEKLSAIEQSLVVQPETKQALEIVGTSLEEATEDIVKLKEETKEQIEKKEQELNEDKPKNEILP